ARCPAPCEDRYTAASRWRKARGRLPAARSDKVSGGAVATATTTDRLPASIGQRLAWIAARVPGRTAIVEADARVSYAQLDWRATAIARCILAAPATGPQFVCLLFENRIPAIEAIFGAAKSGRAYVPLDAGDPDERLRFILRDSEPVALLTERTLLERGRALVPPSGSVIDIGTLDRHASADALPRVDPDSLANLYYTSGSTGT